MGKEAVKKLTDLIDPKKEATKEWFLSLLDDEKQFAYENERLSAVMRVLRAVVIGAHKRKIAEAEEAIAELKKEDNTAENYLEVSVLLEKIKAQKAEIEGFRPYFDEPYFARMDLVDDKEGYNSYYIGKRGDVQLEIIDWRAPIARRYYQKSKVNFSYGDYDYKVILRRAIHAVEGKVEDFKNEFLSVREYLTEEEIGGRDEEFLFDPYLREIIESRKEETEIKDIIRTIQEQQYEIITCDQNSNFVLQGCAGSGKTMVMLHRLSYLLYNDDDLRPHDVLMLTPSNSFNAFIDELTKILELESVETMTVHDYFLTALEKEKIYLRDKIDYSVREPKKYLTYVYSSRFVEDAKKALDKIYDDVYGLFVCDECKSYILDVGDRIKKQFELYDVIKNASLRIRKAVLGDIKEKVGGGGLYYTKSFRTLMNAYTEIEDFLNGVLHGAKAKNPTYFYRQLLPFFKASNFAAKKSEKILQQAIDDLMRTKEEVKREIVDLRRYKQRVLDKETYVYADRIDMKEKQLVEADRVAENIGKILDNSEIFEEFYTFLSSEKAFVSLGSGTGFVDVIRYLYRCTVKKFKLSFGMTEKRMYFSDAYAICQICSLIGKRLSPRFSYLFIDEGQDVSENEFKLLREMNPTAKFNIFGDLKQNITDYRGIGNWEESFPDYKIYHLNRNYRNTNKVVEFVAKGLRVDMLPTGVEGVDVQRITIKRVNSFFKDKKGLKAVICHARDKKKLVRKNYNVLSETGKISKTKINLLTVFESKGLEFSYVVVCDKGMSSGEKYIAYTRALIGLAILEV